MKKFLPFLIVFVIIFSILGFYGFQAYNRYFGVPNDTPTGPYSFEVKSGDNFRTVAKKLSEDRVGYESALLLASSQTTVLDLMPGVYQLELDKTPPSQIIDQINQESQRLTDQIAANNKPSVSITFREGITLDQVAQLLEDNKVLSADQYKEFAKDPNNFSRSTYPFLPEPLTCTYGDLSNCAKYYVEGYLYPDTYSFFLPSTPEQVTQVFLNNFNTKVWSKVKDQATPQEFDKAMIMAAVIEKETGRPIGGVNNTNREEVNNERAIMAGVFYNRLESNIKWQSDVTAEYGFGRKLCQSTLVVENCIFLDSPEAKTLYNTYAIAGYPIGPVTSPQFDNINAALNPTANDNIFFVSDASGKKYFTKTLREHEQAIADVNKINRELGF